MGDKKIGNDLSKWYICREKHGGRNPRWYVCPPWRDIHGNSLNLDGGGFASGAEAFVSYASGADIAHMAARTATPPAVEVVEPWHGKAAVNT